MPGQESAPGREIVLREGGFRLRHFRHFRPVTQVTWASRLSSLTIARMDRRRQSRVFVELPVKIWGMDANSRPFTQPASLRTISGRGATLQGVDVQLKPGDLVD